MRFWKRKKEPEFALEFRLVWGDDGRPAVWAVVIRNGTVVERIPASGFPYGNYKGDELWDAFADWLEDQ